MMTKGCVDVNKNWKAYSNDSGEAIVKRTTSLSSVCRYTDI